MNLTTITFSELRYVVAVSDTGHFGRAVAGRALASFVRAHAPRAVRAVPAGARP